MYFPDDRPGITRRRAGRGWSYRAPDGTRIDCTTERRRIEALAVPPAYLDVWICPEPRGHLQATGRDTRQRKQYRYHPDWTALRAERKYASLPGFGEALPRIRRHIREGLKGEAGDRDFAIAAVLAMIDRLSLRIGNRDYAEQNGSYGATTLRPDHLSLTKGGLRLAYTAKGGRQLTRQVKDRTLARALHRLDDLPGATLVSWVDADGEAHEVGSAQVNERLSELAGMEATAKTFRTWNGSVAALSVALADENPTIKAMAEAAAERLGNTPAIARGSYIHPQVIALAEDAAPRAALEDPPARDGLRVDERRLLKLIG